MRRLPPATFDQHCCAKQCNDLLTRPDIANPKFRSHARNRLQFALRYAMSTFEQHAGVGVQDLVSHGDLTAEVHRNMARCSACTLQRAQRRETLGAEQRLQTAGDADVLLVIVPMLLLSREASVAAIRLVLNAAQAAQRAAQRAAVDCNTSVETGRML